MAATNRDPITGLLHYEFPQEGLQKHMHELIYEFVGKYFDRRRNVDQTIDELTRQLYDGNSSLYQALCHIRKTSTFDASDYEIRFQYLEVKGPRRTSSITKSQVVLEAAAYFYAKVYYFLHTIYGSKTSEEVMVVCPFAETLEWWDQVIEKKMATVNKRLEARGLPVHGRNHHPRLLSNSDDKDIQSTIVIIDPENQDGTEFGQGFFKQEMVKIAISRAKEAVIIIGNSCKPPADEGYRRYVRYTEMESALNAAHGYARFNRSLLTLEEYELDEPLVSLADIPVALLLDAELKAYAKLRNSSDGFLAARH